MLDLFLKMIDGPILYSKGRIISISEQKLHFVSLIATHHLHPVSRDTISSVMWAVGSKKILNHRIAQLIHATNKHLGGRIIHSIGARHLAMNPTILRTDIAEAKSQVDGWGSIEFWQQIEERFLCQMEARTSPDFIIWRKKTINSLRQQHNSHKTIYVTAISENNDIGIVENERVSETTFVSVDYSAARLEHSENHQDHAFHVSANMSCRDDIVKRLLSLCANDHQQRAHLIRLNGTCGVGKSRTLSFVESSLRSSGKAIATLRAHPNSVGDLEPPLLNLFSGASWTEISSFLPLECETEGEEIQLPRPLSGKHSEHSIRSKSGLDPILRVVAKYLSNRFQNQKLYIFLDSDDTYDELYDYVADYFVQQIHTYRIFVFRSTTTAQGESAPELVPRTESFPDCLYHDIAIEPLGPRPSIELAQTILPGRHRKALASGAAYLGGGIPRRILWIARQLLNATESPETTGTDSAITGISYILTRMSDTQIRILTKLAVTRFGIRADKLYSEITHHLDQPDVLALETFGWLGYQNGRLFIADVGLREAIRSQASPLALDSARRELLATLRSSNDPEEIIERIYVLLDMLEYDEAVDEILQVFNRFDLYQRYLQELVVLFDMILHSTASPLRKYDVILAYADRWTEGKCPTPSRSTYDRSWSIIRLGGEARDSLRARAMISCARIASPERSPPDTLFRMPPELDEALARRDYQCFGMIAVLSMRALEHHLVRPELLALIDLVHSTVREVENVAPRADTLLLSSISAADIHFGNISRGKKTLEILASIDVPEDNRMARHNMYIWNFIYLYHNGELNTADGINFRREYGRYAYSENDPTVRINYAINSSIWFLDTGDFEAAQLALKEVEAHMSVMVPKAVWRKFHYNRGEIDLRAGEADSALQHFRRAEEVFGPEHKDPGSLLISAATAIARRTLGQSVKPYGPLPPLNALAGRWALDLTLVYDAHRRAATSRTERENWVESVLGLMANDCIPSRIWRAKLQVLALRASKEWGIRVPLPERLQLADLLQERGVSNLSSQLRAG